MTGKFEFTDAEYAAYRESEDEHVPSIIKMCKWLEVSRSGFYEWRSAPESATAKRRAELALYIRKLFDDSDGTYGYRRVHAGLVAWGVPAGPELVRSIMRELGLEACQPKPWRFSLTEGDGREHDIPDLLKRDFTADAPGAKMVGDITVTEVKNVGYLYLSSQIQDYMYYAMANGLEFDLIVRASTVLSRPLEDFVNMTASPINLIRSLLP